MRRDPAQYIQEGRRRVIIENVSPCIDGGRYPIKRVTGESVTVEADLFGDGHDLLAAAVLYRPDTKQDWEEVLMTPTVNDRWRASFETEKIGRYQFKVIGWIDHFKTWRKEIEKKYQAQIDVSVELLSGGQLMAEAASNATGPDQTQLQSASEALKQQDLAIAARVSMALSPAISQLMQQYAPRKYLSESVHAFEVIVDPNLARFSAWYEFFPRSTAREPGKHGTFKDCERQLERAARMGFDVVYLPPIHPVGRTFRKGKNNNPEAAPGEPGSPWGIGASEGGHKSVHPELGTLEDFRSLVKKAKSLNLEIAMDIAFQCAPDHPYVKEHPEWFKKRADGSIQYAENPPKKYQDIYPIYFETEDWQALWKELKSIFDFWIEQGVNVFRVDNPHTKSFYFWEWCITEIKRDHPQVLFLSEAFTRPKLMYYLAKAGFSQSYNYFPWRDTKADIVAYFTELTQSAVKEFFRPNLWPNTPDILTQYLQYGGRPAHIIRLILAATLGASYGIYGPVYELCENKPRHTGSEEYLDSEKYEIRFWQFDEKQTLTELITRVNTIRRQNEALHSNDSLQFQPTDNDRIVAYTKQTKEGDNIILTIVNVDPKHIQRGWITLDLEKLGLPSSEQYQVHELLTDSYYLWQGPRNYVELDPSFAPAHIFRIRKHVRTERDFDYFL
ncbi:MAG: alpha-1,4-glucan--maltose-1-phosphate maltosyltransferase [Verrucomicrobiales bacterium]